MHTALYVIWFLIPAVFFILALWSKLEQMGGSVKRDNPLDLLHQGSFILAVVIICVIIDQIFLEDLVNMFSPAMIPLGFYQAFLLPLLLLIAAKLIGPSKKILISSKSDSKQSRTPKRRS